MSYVSLTGHTRRAHGNDIDQILANDLTLNRRKDNVPSYCLIDVITMGFVV